VPWFCAQVAEAKACSLPSLLVEVIRQQFAGIVDALLLEAVLLDPLDPVADPFDPQVNQGLVVAHHSYLVHLGVVVMNGDLDSKFKESRVGISQSV